MISLCLATYRPGGFDLLINSIRGTSQEIPWELVVVDDFPGRVERGIAKQKILDLGIPLRWYGGSKNKFYPEAKGGLCCAWNSALLHTTGERIVFISDFCFLPSYWLRAWEFLYEKHDRKSLISGSAIVYHGPKPTIVDDFYTWMGGVLEQGVIPKWPWVPKVWESFYACYPIDYLLEINGFDERADHCHCWPVQADIAQAGLLGWELLVNSEICVAHMVDHRTWDCSEEQSPTGNEGMWKITHLQSTPDEPKWEVPSPNPWNFKEERIKTLWGDGK